MIKITKPKDDTLCDIQKILHVKVFLDHGDLEKKAKVKLMKCNKRTCHASWVLISSLYLTCSLINGHLSIPLVIMGKLNFDPYNPEIRVQ